MTKPRTPKPPRRRAGPAGKIESAEEIALRRRREIKRAAVRVFARKGFEAARVSDIAREAGVAHGLVYHYFDTKESVLDAIVTDQLGLLRSVLDSVDAAELPVREKLAGIVRFMLSSYRVAGDVVRVLLLETMRSSLLRAPARARAVSAVFARLEEMLRRHQADGTLRADADPRMVSFVIIGALENLLTGFSVGALSATDEAFTRAEAAVVETLWQGLAPRPGAI